MKSITENALTKCINLGQKAKENVPTGHCRIAQEVENDITIQEIMNYKRSKEVQVESIKNQTIVYLKQYNQGTKKWSQYITIFELSYNETFDHETKYFYFFKSGLKIYKDNLITVIH